MSAPVPPRRPSAAVYRRRRLVFGVGALAIILALVLLIVRPGSGTPDATPSPTPTIPLPTATKSATPTPTASAAVDVSKLPRCSPDVMEVSAQVDGASAQTYGASAKPALTLSITNTGPSECYFNVGTNAQVFTITSGSETYWKSTDCQTGATETLAVFKPGQTLTSNPISWGRTLSPSRAGGTCDAKSPAVPAKGASYFLRTSVDGVDSTSSAQMILN